MGLKVHPPPGLEEQRWVKRFIPVYNIGYNVEKRQYYSLCCFEKGLKDTVVNRLRNSLNEVLFRSTSIQSLV